MQFVRRHWRNRGVNLPSKNFKKPLWSLGKFYTFFLYGPPRFFLHNGPSKRKNFWFRPYYLENIFHEQCPCTIHQMTYLGAGWARVRNDLIICFFLKCTELILLAFCHGIFPVGSTLMNAQISYTRSDSRAWCGGEWI